MPQDDIAAIAAKLTAAQQRMLLTAEPRRRALDPESLFVTDSAEPIPGATIVTLAGMMLTDYGVALRAQVQSEQQVKP